MELKIFATNQFLLYIKIIKPLRQLPSLITILRPAHMSLLCSSQIVYKNKNELIHPLPLWREIKMMGRTHEAL